MKHLLFSFLLLSTLAQGQTSTETAVSNYLNTIRNNRAQLTAFFQSMPKGGDLHHHYSGSVYAEFYFEQIISADYWINVNTLELYEKMDPAPTGGSGIKRLSAAAADGQLEDIRYRLFKLWSAKDYNGVEVASDRHFFESFSYFNRVDTDDAKGLQELKQRAKAENLRYLETMLSSMKHGVNLQKLNRFQQPIRRFAAQQNRDSLYAVFDEIYRQLLDSGLVKNAQAYNNRLENLHRVNGLDDSLFTLRFQNFVRRTINNPVDVFAALAASCISADNSRLVVGVNIVAPEDNQVSMKDYWAHMQMFGWCKRKFPNVKFALHAGELTIGLVEPEDLTWHINAAVRDAGAHRIGHGVDMAFEHQAYELLNYMRQQSVAIEINLSSNEFILNVSHDAHPISLYREAGVPIVICTDDAGILRTSISEQFVLLANRYPEITYQEIKQYVYNSIQYSFIEEPLVKQTITTQLEQAFQAFESRILLHAAGKKAGALKKG